MTWWGNDGGAGEKGQSKSKPEMRLALPAKKQDSWRAWLFTKVTIKSSY